jgi:putative membrane protein
MRASHLAFLAAIAVAPAISAQGMKPALDDAAIVGIFAAANTWDISTGGLASTKATRQDVKDFGLMLKTVHTAVLGQASDLARKLGVTPTPVAKDFALLVDYNATMKTLNSLSGPAFDKAFLEHEVAYHKAVIDAVTNTFLPAIKNAELKKYVESVAPAFKSHMDAAQNLLNKK